MTVKTSTTFLYAFLMSTSHPDQSILHEAEWDLYESVTTQTVFVSSGERNTIPGHQDKVAVGDITR